MLNLINKFLNSISNKQKNEIIAKPEQITKEHILDNFDNINLSGNISATINVNSSDINKLFICTSTLQMENISFCITDNILIIENKSAIPINLNLNVKNLDSIDLINNAKCIINDLSANTFIAKVLDKSKLNLYGNCDNFCLKCSNSSVDAQGFISQTSEIRLYQSGNVKVYSTQFVNGIIDGFGQIKVFGNPKSSNIQQTKPNSSVKVYNSNPFELKDDFDNKDEGIFGQMQLPRK